MKWINNLFLGFCALLLVGCVPLPPEPSTTEIVGSDALMQCQRYNVTLQNRIRELENLISNENGLKAEIARLEGQQAKFQDQNAQLQTEIKKLEIKRDRIIDGPKPTCTNSPNLKELEQKNQFLKASLETSEQKLKNLERLLKEICQRPPTTDEMQQLCKGETRLPPSPDRITVNCGGHNIDFVKVIPKPSTVNIALTEENAKKFYQQAQSQSSSPLYPFVFRAVPEGGTMVTNKYVDEFWIQSEPLKEDLYKTIITDGSVNSVSYNDAMRVVTTLNDHCPSYKFDLPEEKHFVYLAREIYDPVNGKDPFQSCSALEDRSSADGVKQLVGNQWQLTKSSCESWSSDDNDPSRQCNPQSFIKKGGTTNSKDATECLPEYRAISTPDVREPNTTMRLILVSPR